MSNVNLAAPPIAPGYDYAVRLEVDGLGDVVFPSGVELRSQVRRFSYSSHVIAELTTDNGGLVRVDDRTVELRIGGEQTASIDGRTVVLDLVRTDTAPETYLYLQLQLAVMFPVTKAQANG